MQQLMIYSKSSVYLHRNVRKNQQRKKLTMTAMMKTITVPPGCYEVRQRRGIVEPPNCGAHIMKIIFIALVIALSAHFSRADSVNIEGLGAVEGFQNGLMLEYLGVPFAEPPTGANRFKAPQPVKPWSNTLKADRKISCISAVPTLVPQQEDCLVLNVWRPVECAKSNEKLPVLVYIHGGAWKVGSGLDNYINATHYVKEGVIFVTINYRLDILSYFAHKALTEEDPLNPTNFGLLDQRVAIEWVSKYISSFNGDPNRITVMGESAGAQSIVVHMRSWQEYKPKFHQAILMSAVPAGTLVYLNQAEEFGENMIKILGCDLPTNERVMECLRSLPAEELMLMRSQRLQFFGAHWEEGVYLVNDGVNFKWTSNVFYSGKYDLDIPLIIGTTADEGTLFSKMSFPLKSQLETTYMQLLMSFSRHYVRSGSPDLLPKLLKNYSILNPRFNKSNDPVHWAYSELVGDGYFICPTQRVTKALSKRQPVYGYVFNWTNSPEGSLRAHHAVDLNYAFGGDAMAHFGNSIHSEIERDFSNNIVKYFSAFIKTGKPGAVGLPAWPIYGNEGNLMSLEPEFKVFNNYKTEICSFWEENFPSGYAYMGEDYLIHEPFTSKLLNKYPFVALFFLWRKRRFAKPVLALLLILTALFWYKVITKCCCRNKNAKKNNTPKASSDKKQKTQ
eukprot:TRINITY_DN467_c0_g1_i4.p1 TRINITY_DN467_c0_g1~~TRINITY_DN467_c0_g1_i4.p1  ORF type:complete len:674 (+),score=91.95 TRINITY_DN467_c0_g1_i4:546-2567(+)